MRGGARRGAGRPEGSKSATGEELRQKFIDFLEDNADKLQSDFNELTPYQRWRVTTMLLNRLVPTKFESQSTYTEPVTFVIQPIGEEPEIDG